MNWQSEWTALAARIDGLLAAADFLARARFHGDEAYGESDRLNEQARDIMTALRSFVEGHATQLPPFAERKLSTFVRSESSRMDDLQVKDFSGLRYRVSALAGLRSEMDYHLSDFEARTNRLVERAFLHLQQSIAVDNTLRSRWEAAFKVDETKCERLGAVHLLQHGIVAFKIHAEGARTDLVFGEPVDAGSSIAAVANALVLTEWKRVQKASDADDKTREARAQLQTYSLTPLAGIELTQYRYAVLVSAEQLPAVPDEQRDGVTYRHLNIAVTPLSPSQNARKKK